MPSTKPFALANRSVWDVCPPGLDGYFIDKTGAIPATAMTMRITQRADQIIV
jgi:hypothetical protein